MSEQVLVRRVGDIGWLSLNRPKVIHALNLAMVETMIEALLEWRDDSTVAAVVIDHAEGRGFCAGGDIAMLRHSALSDDGMAGRRFFFREYQLNHLIKTWPKPAIAFMDGITMGGGVGLAGPAQIRIATEQTRFAMPETGIGLFPDVGGGWYLSRLPGRLGQYLALTGARLDGGECLRAGVATHHVPSGALPEIKRAIAGCPADIERILEDAKTIPPVTEQPGRGAEIDRLFAPDTLEGILAALGEDGGPFARDTLAVLTSRSPLSCKVSLRELAQSAALADFADEMAMEYRIASRILVLPDFAEGVRAVIVEKDNAPRWTWPTASDVTDDLLDAIFSPLDHKEEWRPL